jgi:hypothetical protein
MTYDQQRRALGNWRGRRLLLCRGTDLLRQVINAMGEDDGSLPACDPCPVPAPSRRQRADLLALNDLLRSMMMGVNDGGG